VNSDQGSTISSGDATSQHMQLDQGHQADQLIYKETLIFCEYFRELSARRLKMTLSGFVPTNTKAGGARR
jgi:hypothetical protein